MDFALSTNWNSHRHVSGEALVDEILSLGFDSLEVGYNYPAGLVEGLMSRLQSGAICAGSVHAFTPVPIGAPSGHPELFLMADLDEDLRRLAVFHMRATLNFAQTVGARAVVAHAGRVPIGGYWERHSRYHAADNIDNWRYRWNRKRMLRVRQRQIDRHLNALRRSLDVLIPEFAQAGVVLALENLPSWDALPHADEIRQLAVEYGRSLRCWHDIGHGQIMENCGLCPHRETIWQLRDLVAGTHIHDVRGALQDHQAPGHGGIDFSGFGFLADHHILHVLEPAPAVTAEDLKAGLLLLRQTWITAPNQSKGDGLL